ncbi:hypothetical protein HBI73_059580 [Parastagonospora nodorum]|nr:hypothetical protein HBI73_059580 [Parastagonospora nodorum]KAH5289902.1 hypothetical protein HBI11_220620 [Parastagonospora nodorum]KAH5324261.1 hypothetical protein HBI12_087960 [Parastagonospora nodorum]KAH6389894.1 hypothetical protein HBI08_200740 [Parastagonospora nodorum]
MSTGSDSTSITREAFEVAANDPLRVNPPEVNDAGVNDAEVDDARRRGFIEIERDDRDHTMPSRLARWQMHMALDDGNPTKDHSKLGKLAAMYQGRLPRRLPRVGYQRHDHYCIRSNYHRCLTTKLGWS